MSPKKRKNMNDSMAFAMFYVNVGHVHTSNFIACVGVFMKYYFNVRANYYLPSFCVCVCVCVCLLY